MHLDVILQFWSELSATQPLPAYSGLPHFVLGNCSAPHALVVQLGAGIDQASVNFGLIANLSLIVTSYSVSRACCTASLSSLKRGDEDLPSQHLQMACCSCACALRAEAATCIILPLSGRLCCAVCSTVGPISTPSARASPGRHHTHHIPGAWVLLPKLRVQLFRRPCDSHRQPATLCCTASKHC